MSSGSNDQFKKANKAQATISAGQYNAFTDPRLMYFRDLMSTLSTAGRGPSAAPIIQRAVAGSTYGKETAIADARTRAAKAGMTPTQIAATVGPISVRGGQATEAVRQQLVRQRLEQIPNAALGATQQSQAALGGVIQRGAAAQAQAQANQTQLIGGGAAAAGAVLGAVIIAV